MMMILLTVCFCLYNCCRVWCADERRRRWRDKDSDVFEQRLSSGSSGGRADTWWRRSARPRRYLAGTPSVQRGRRSAVGLAAGTGNRQRSVAVRRRRLSRLVPTRLPDHGDDDEFKELDARSTSAVVRRQRRLPLRRAGAASAAVQTYSLPQTLPRVHSAHLARCATQLLHQQDLAVAYWPLSRAHSMT